MGDVVRIKIACLIQTLILVSLQGWNIFAFAPQGCSFEDGIASCYFQQWAPPLLDKDFGLEPLYELRLYDIHGNIPNGSFSGLTAPDTTKGTSIQLNCGAGKTRLSKDIFTPNLNWVMELKIILCHLENGLPSGLLKNFKSLQKLHIWRDTIDGLVPQDTLAGLTNLQEIAFRGSVKSRQLPSGFFDGLINLTMIQIEITNINFIPPNWFNGLVNLEKIYLPFNDIQTLPKGLFNELKVLTHVTLDHNPWNCSCEIIWLLDWSNITDGGKCAKPLYMENTELERALPSLNCTNSTAFSPTEISETRTVCSSDFAGIMLSKIATHSLDERKATTSSFSESFAMQTESSYAPTILTQTSTAEATSVTSIPTASGIAFITNEIGKTTFAPTFYSTTTSVRNIIGNDRHVFLNNASNIVLISTVGILSVLLMGAVVLF